MKKEDKQVISLDSRPLRDLGNSIGQSFDKKALSKLGLVDEDGHVVDEVQCQQRIYDDGSIRIDISLPDETTASD